MAYDNGNLGSYTSGAGFVSASRLLTSAETQLVSTELTNDPAGRGYKTNGVYKDSADIADLLNGTYSIANTATQGAITLTTLPQGAVITLATTLAAKKASLIIAGTPPSDAVSYIVDTVLPNAAKQIDLSLTDSNTQALLQVLEQTGMLTTAQVTALTTQPDPSWQATLLQPSRMSAIGLPTVMVEPKDIQTITGVA